MPVRRCSDSLQQGQQDFCESWMQAWPACRAGLLLDMCLCAGKDLATCPMQYACDNKTGQSSS